MLLLLLLLLLLFVVLLFCYSMFSVGFSGHLIFTSGRSSGSAVAGLAVVGPAWLIGFRSQEAQKYESDQYGCFQK